jgi:hypothetical protein
MGPFYVVHGSWSEPIPHLVGYEIRKGSVCQWLRVWHGYLSGQTLDKFSHSKLSMTRADHANSSYIIPCTTPRLTTLLCFLFRCDLIHFKLGPGLNVPFGERRKTEAPAHWLL